jgi:hypothetical protein
VSYSPSSAKIDGRLSGRRGRQRWTLSLSWIPGAHSVATKDRRIEIKVEKDQLALACGRWTFGRLPFWQGRLSGGW